VFLAGRSSKAGAVVSGLNHLAVDVALRPPVVADDQGSEMSAGQAGLLGLRAQGVVDWRARRAPLGTVPSMYRQFCVDLYTAAQRDGVRDLDARLKGSAAIFFSGSHKDFPRSEREASELAEAKLGPLPQRRIADIQAAYGAFVAQGACPARRPFDSMYRLGIDRGRSDYDVQISSRTVARLCREAFQRSDAASPPLKHPQHGYFDDDWFELACPEIASWADEWSGRLRRLVNVKAFDRAGPPDRTEQIGPLSSHFRDTDWMLTQPRVED
jgi:hypothetical protein